MGITLVGAIAAAAGDVGVEEVLSPYYIKNLNVSENIGEAISTAVVGLPISYLNVVVGELVPLSISSWLPEGLFVAEKNDFPCGYYF